MNLQIQIVHVAIAVYFFEKLMYIIYSLSNWRFLLSLSGHVGHSNHIHNWAYNG